MSVSIDYGDPAWSAFTNQIRIVPRPPWPAVDYEVSIGGDSGSVWLNEGNNAAIGLHFAGETDPMPASENAICSPIDAIATELNFSFLPVLCASMPHDPVGPPIFEHLRAVPDGSAKASFRWPRFRIRPPDPPPFRLPMDDRFCRTVPRVRRHPGRRRGGCRCGGAPRWDRRGGDGRAGGAASRRTSSRGAEVPGPETDRMRLGAGSPGEGRGTSGCRGRVSSPSRSPAAGGAGRRPTRSGSGSRWSRPCARWSAVPRFARRHPGGRRRGQGAPARGLGKHGTLPERAAAGRVRPRGAADHSAASTSMKPPDWRFQKRA